MKFILLQLLLPPLVIALPWLPSAWRKAWLRCGILLILWLVGWVVMLRFWAGPGLILLLCVGLFAAATTRVRTGRQSAA